MKSHHFFLVLFFFVLNINLFAQKEFEGKRPPNANHNDTTNQNNRPKPGKAYGIVIDPTTKLPVEFATIAVVKMKDNSVVTGGITNEKGQFKIDQIPFGQFKLRITFIGYTTIETEPFFIKPPDNFEFNAGKISLNPATGKLAEVTVEGEKNDIINSIDKKVYNIDKNIINTGGTVTEVLQNIPSVTVDIDGNVSMRGNANVTVLIDGKPSGLTGANRQAVLQQIPASSVDQIEVITNPSAKYDADGMSGIINIKTKKDKLKGFNGNVQLGAGSRDKYNAAISFNNRTEKVNLYGNYSYRYERRYRRGVGEQYNMLPDTNYYFTNKSYGVGVNNFHMGKLGADFYVNPTTTIGLSGSIAARNNVSPESIDYEYLDANKLFVNGFNRVNRNEDVNTTYDFNVDYKHTYAETKSELTASANYSLSDRSSDQSFKNSFLNMGDLPYQKNKNTGNNTSSVVQVDFVKPIADKGKVEMGAKATLRLFDNTQNSVLYNKTVSDYFSDARYSDQFLYNEQVYAAYGMFTYKRNNFTYSGGLRIEEALVYTDSKSTAKRYTNDYFALYPSAALKYTFGNNNDIQLSYSRRVNRPGMQQVNPFIDFSDTLNLRQGNPFLQPEFTHSLELGFSKNWEQLTFSGAVYYRHLNNMISHYRTINTTTGINTVGFVNFSTAENIGIESVLRYSFKKLGSIMWSLNAFQNIINAQNIQADLQNDAFTWNTRLNINLKAGKNTAIQIAGNYMAPNVSPQGSFQFQGGVDIGVKQDLMKGKLSISANLNDVFDTKQMNINLSDIYFKTASFRKRESQVLMVTLSYRFGSSEGNKFGKKKDRSSGEQQMPAGEMGDF